MSRKLEFNQSDVKPRQRRRRSLTLIEESGGPIDPKSHAGFALRLAYLVQKAGSALALAEAAKVSDSSIHLWLKKSEPSREKLVALADATGVSLEWLATGTGPIEQIVSATGPPGFTLLRQAYRIIPGMIPIAFADTYLGLTIPALTFPIDVVSTFASGEVMSPTIRDFDVVLIDVGNKQKKDGALVAIEAGSDLLIRRLQRRIGGGYRLLCDNREYPPTDVDELEIVGHVVWRGGKLR